MILKLSRADMVRDDALHQIDMFYAGAIAEEMGPFAALHALKRVQALSGVESPLVPDAADVLRQSVAQDVRINDIETKRLAAKLSIRLATTAAEIREIVENERRSTKTPFVG